MSSLVANHCTIDGGYSMNLFDENSPSVKCITRNEPSKDKVIT